MEEADYQSQVKKLTNLVDGGVDTLDFIAVSGTAIIYHDTDINSVLLSRGKS